MIVVDSSVLIANIRGLDTPAVRKLRTAREVMLIADVVVLEILRGARDHAHAERLHQQLERFQIVPMLGHRLALRAAENYRVLRAQGFTMSKTVDLIIGTFCIDQNHRLLHSDRDFGSMVEFLGLQTA